MSVHWKEQNEKPKSISDPLPKDREFNRQIKPVTRGFNSEPRKPLKKEATDA